MYHIIFVQFILGMIFICTWDKRELIPTRSPDLDELPVLWCPSLRWQPTLFFMKFLKTILKTFSLEIILKFLKLNWSQLFLKINNQHVFALNQPNEKYSF